MRAERTTRAQISSERVSASVRYSLWLRVREDSRLSSEFLPVLKGGVVDVALLVLVVGTEGGHALRRQDKFGAIAERERLVFGCLASKAQREMLVDGGGLLLKAHQLEGCFIEKNASLVAG